MLGCLSSTTLAQPPVRPLPASITGQPSPRMLYFSKDKTQPANGAIRPIDWQDPQPDAGTIPLPPSVIAVIKRSEKDSVDNADLFALRSESDIRKEVIAESGPQSIFGQFPPKTKLSDVDYKGRAFEPFCKHVEPMFVCHRRLYFEEKNAERQAWEFGPLQSITSALYFYKDLFSLPYNVGTRPCDRWECSAGKCLPGDPTPYLIYPIEFSVTSAMLQAGTVVGLAAIFP